MAHTPSQAIILARLSDAREGDERGIDGQVDDGHVHAARIGWTIGPAATHVIIENTENGNGEMRGVSAFKRRKIKLPDGRTELRTVRPGFRRALAMLADGRADGLLAVDLDRAMRDPRDLEDLIDVIEASRPRIPVESLTGSLRLANDADITTARIMVAVANKASRDTGRRVAAARRRQAADGEYGGGKRRFGFEADGITIREDEAEEIRKAASAVLAGSSLRSVAAGLRCRSVPTVTGGQWTTSSLRDILLRPSNAGLAIYRPVSGERKQLGVHEGEIVSRDTEWPPILADSQEKAEERWRELVAALTDPSRKTTRGNEPKWLGSLIYRCGCCCERCQPDERGHTSVAVSGGRAYARTYTCRGHSHLRRSAGSGSLTGPVTGVDDFVSRLIVARLSKPDAADLLAPPEPGPDKTGMRAELTRLQRLLDDQARLHARGIITTSQLEAGSVELRAKIHDVEEQLDAGGEHDPLAGLAGRADAAQIWEMLAIGRKRAIVRTLVDVTLMPRGRGGRLPGGGYFDPSGIRITWKS